MAARLSPALRELLIDSRYLLSWPRVAAVAPAGSVIAGLVVGLVHPTDLYAGSLGVLCLLVALGAAGSTTGLWFLAGFLPADLLLRPGSWSRGVSKPGLAIADVVLVLLLVLIAAAAPRLKMELVLWSGRFVKGGSQARRVELPAVEILGGALVYMILAWCWLQSVPTLIRPAYLWAGRSLAHDAMVLQPVQEHVGLLTLLGGAAAAILSWVEWLSRQEPRRGSGGSMAHLVDEPASVGERRSHPLWLRYLVVAVIAVIIGAGLWSGAGEAVLLALVVGVGVYVRQRAGRFTSWARLVARLPEAARMVGIIFGTTLIGALILPRLFDQPGSLWPILLVTAIGLLLAAVALPAREHE